MYRIFKHILKKLDKVNIELWEQLKFTYAAAFKRIKEHTCTFTNRMNACMYNTMVHEAFNKVNCSSIRLCSYMSCLTLWVWILPITIKLIERVIIKQYIRKKRKNIFVLEGWDFNLLRIKILPLLQMFEYPKL